MWRSSEGGGRVRSVGLERRRMGAMTFDSEGGEWWEVAALALKEMSMELTKGVQVHSQSNDGR